MKQTYRGSCHCGKVRFEADVDLAEGSFRCNCSICFKSRAWLASAKDLRLLSGEAELRDYQFGPKRLHHPFCASCGVRPFSRGSDAKGNPMYVVRLNCLDGVDDEVFAGVPVKYFNMRHDDFKTPPAETRHL